MLAYGDFTEQLLQHIAFAESKDQKAISAALTALAKRKAIKVKVIGPYTVIDHRHRCTAEKRKGIVDLMLQFPVGIHLALWTEGEALQDIGGSPRHKLQRSRVLAIWSSPPDSLTLSRVLTTVHPQIVHLYAEHPTPLSTPDLLSRLSSILHLKLHGGEHLLSLDSLAAACAERPQTILTGLNCLSRKWSLTFTQIGNYIFLAPANRSALPPNQESKKEMALLQRSQQETLLNRLAFRQAPLEEIFQHKALPSSRQHPTL